MWSKGRNLAFVWIFAVFLIQNSLFFLFSDKTPWILLAAVLFYAMREGPVFGSVIGCYAGFFPDMYSTGHLGISTLIYGFLGLLSGFSGSTLFSESPVTQSLLPVLAYYVAMCLHLFMHRVIAQEKVFTLALLSDAFQPLPLILMAISSPIVFTALKKLSSGRRRNRSVWL